MEKINIDRIDSDIYLPLNNLEESPKVQVETRVSINVLPTNETPGAFSTKRNQEAIMLMELDEL